MENEEIKVEETGVEETNCKKGSNTGLFVAAGIGFGTCCLVQLVRKKIKNRRITRDLKEAQELEDLDTFDDVDEVEDDQD